MQYFLYILLAILILLLMVTIHEFGHYTFGKLFHFEIDEFAVGFGPKLLSHKSKGGMLWSLRVLPLGGFCAFYGEGELESGTKSEEKSNSETQSEEGGKANAVLLKPDSTLVNADESKAEAVKVLGVKVESAPLVFEAAKPESVPSTARVSFEKQPPWKRIIVLLGGVTFNFVSAIVFSLIFICAVGYAAPEVTALYSNESGAYASEVVVGDIITSVNGKSVSIMDDFQTLAAKIENDETATLGIIRDGKDVTVSVKKQSITYVDADGNTQNYYGFGFSSKSAYRSVDFLYGLKYCVPYTGKLSWSILGSFGQLLSGKVPITALTGPIGTIDMMAKVSLTDWRNILLLLPLIASNLAIFNLFPIPSLDGMKIIFTSIEWARKKPINRKVEGIMNIVGMAVLLLFVFVVDIVGCFAR